MEREEKQDGETVHEVGEASGKEQQEPMTEREDFSEQQDLMATSEDLSSENVYIGEGKEDSIKWYAEWPEYEELLISHLSFRSEEQLDSAGGQPTPEEAAAEVSVLVPGCKNSKLTEDLYDAGFKNITYLDFSKDAISDMLKRNVGVRPEVKWRAMDLTNMQFANATFDAIVDKGVLDSLMMPIPSSLGRPYLYEVKRVLRAGGKYICLTLADRLILSDLLFPMFRFGWKMKLYAIGQEASSRDPKLPTFMVVAERDSSPAVYTISSSLAHDLSEVLLKENKIRLEYAEGDGDVIYSITRLILGELGNFSMLVPGRRIKLSFGILKGVINHGVLLDAKEDSGPFIYPYAVFVVPQNRVHDWIYTSEKGQWHIVNSAKASRLLMISLNSSDSNLSMDDIQMDLSPFVIQLEPADCGERFQTPYMSEPNEIDKKEIVYKGSSVLTGPFVVEDVIFKDRDFIDDDDDDYYKGCTFRRLIFKRNDSVVQTEALLSIKESPDVVKAKIKGKKKISDSQSSRSTVSSGEVKVVHKHLVSPYHRGVVFGIRLVSSYWKVPTSARGLVNTVVIGLGGGLLPMFMKQYLPFLKIEVVEIDDSVLQVARKYFGFSEDESLQVHITDGIKFVKEKADGNSSSKIDILVVDVDSSDSSSSLNTPAESFIDESFLLAVKDSLSEQGLFIIGLISVSSRVREAVHSRVKKVFNCILSLPYVEDMDEVLFALKTTSSTINEDQLSEFRKEFTESLQHEKKWIEKEVDISKSIKLLN